MVSIRKMHGKQAKISCETVKSAVSQLIFCTENGSSITVPSINCEVKMILRFADLKVKRQILEVVDRGVDGNPKFSVFHILRIVPFCRLLYGGGDEAGL